LPPFAEPRLRRATSRAAAASLLVRIAATQTAIAIDLALGLADLPVVQSFKNVRDEPIASLRGMAELRGNARRRRAAPGSREGAELKSAW